MAPGFFSKLLELGKKVWNGIKTGAGVVGKYVIPTARTLGSLMAAAPNPTAKSIGLGLNKGLGLIQPIVQRLEQ